MNANANTKKEYGVYIDSMLSRKVILKITEVGKNVVVNLTKKIKLSVEGKCIPEGFIKSGSVNIISYSAGLIKDDFIEFQVIYKCFVCNPIKDFEVDCYVNNITKAGIHAVKRDNDDNTPITIFVAREHNITNPIFETVEEKDTIRVRIIGTRFELNDMTITAIASLLDKGGYENNNYKRQENTKRIENEIKAYEEKMKVVEEAK
jgi:DNA-directed RNA polymerase subunit E'/Rpb7